jgi:hypothetical protein
MANGDGVPQAARRRGRKSKAVVLGGRALGSALGVLSWGCRRWAMRRKEREDEVRRSEENFGVQIPTV